MMKSAITFVLEGTYTVAKEVTQYYQRQGYSLKFYIMFFTYVQYTLQEIEQTTQK